MRQVEVARTIVFDAPRHARGFFEALVVDNLDLGRPHDVEVIFGRRVRRDTIGTFGTAIDRRDRRIGKPPSEVWLSDGPRSTRRLHGPR
jgi:hypothetical protein